MNPALLRPLQIPVFYLLLAGLGLASLAWNAITLPLQALLDEAHAARIGRAAISRIYRTFWRVAGWTGILQMDAQALDVLRDEPGLIVVANHPSVLDALMIVARLPRAACVMKASLMRNPFLGPGAKLARYICNDSAVGTVRECVRDLRRGGQLVLFPEGTRTTRWPLNDFRPGVTGIARLARAPIQIVYIDTDSPFVAKGWPVLTPPPMPIRFAVRLGERIEPTGDEQALLHTLRETMTAGVRTNVVENLRRARGEVTT